MEDAYKKKTVGKALLQLLLWICGVVLLDRLIFGKKEE